MNEVHVYVLCVLPTLLFWSTARTCKEVFIKRAYHTHTHTLADVGLQSFYMMFSMLGGFLGVMIPRTCW